MLCWWRWLRWPAWCVYTHMLPPGTHAALIVHERRCLPSRFPCCQQRWEVERGLLHDYQGTVWLALAHRLGAPALSQHVHCTAWCCMFVQRRRAEQCYGARLTASSGLPAIAHQCTPTCSHVCCMHPHWRAHQHAVQCCCMHTQPTCACCGRVHALGMRMCMHPVLFAAGTRLHMPRACQ